MRSIEESPGLTVGIHNKKQLVCWTDDTVLTSTIQKELQHMVDTVVLEIEKLASA